MYVRKYSSIPNKRGGWNKRVGGNFVEKCVLMGFFFAYMIIQLV